MCRLWRKGLAVISMKKEVKLYKALTVEYELPPGNISSSAVFGHALVHTGILRAKIWNFQNPAGVVDFNLAREWISISSSPRDGRHRAAEVTREKVTLGHTLLLSTAAMFVRRIVAIEDVCPLRKFD